MGLTGKDWHADNSQIVVYNPTKLWTVRTPVAHELFRQEALQAHRNGWLGGISLAQPLRLWVLTTFIVVAAAITALFLVLGSYTQRSTVSGQLVPTQGLATVLSPATGVVNEMDISEGQQVAEGQRLAAVTVPRATLVSGDTQVALEHRLEQRQQGLASSQSAQQAQLRAQSDGLRTQLAQAKRELAQIEAEVVTRQQQARIANETLNKMRPLESERYISPLQVRQQETTALDYAGQVQTLQRQALEMRRSIAQLQQSLDELPGQQQAVDASYQRDLAQLEQERVQTQAQGTLAINAPVTGVIAMQQVKAGQAVQAGQPLMSLLPGDGKLEAELLVPSRAIGFIQPGDKVLLRFQAFPYQKFGHQVGRVARISRSTLSASDTGGQQQSEPFYRITVALAKLKCDGLRQGGRVEAGDVTGCGHSGRETQID
jgi:membrane fusion protein